MNPVAERMFDQIVVNVAAIIFGDVERAITDTRLNLVRAALKERAIDDYIQNEIAGLIEDVEIAERARYEDHDRHRQVD